MPQITYLHDDGSRESVTVAVGANVMRTAIENDAVDIVLDRGAHHVGADRDGQAHTRAVVMEVGDLRHRLSLRFEFFSVRIHYPGRPGGALRPPAYTPRARSVRNCNANAANVPASIAARISRIRFR